MSWISGFSGCFNSVQTRCIVKGEAQKNPLFWRFSGGFWFSQDRLLSRNSTRKPLNLIKSPILTNAPCKTACLYNAPSMQTVETVPLFSGYFQCVFKVILRCFQGVSGCFQGVFSLCPFRACPLELSTNGISGGGLLNMVDTNMNILAHQNRTIAIASDFRVDGAKSPEIPQKEGVLGSEIAARNRKSLATFHRTLKSQCSIAFSSL